MLSCGKNVGRDSTTSHARELLDQKKYHRVIDYLESRTRNSQEQDILIDAYIGASGFELLPFLISLSQLNPTEVREEEHIVQYLARATQTIRLVSRFDFQYVEKAIRLLMKRNLEGGQTEDLFKAGMLNLYKCVDTLKGIGQKYHPKVSVDEEGQRFMVLSEEENMLFLKDIDLIVEAVLLAYLNLRSSYQKIKDFFFEVDRAIESIFNMKLEEINIKVRGKNLKDVIAIILKNNPHIVKRFITWITVQCRKTDVLTELKKLLQEILRHPRIAHLKTIVEQLIKQVENSEGKYCEIHTDPNF